MAEYNLDRALFLVKAAASGDNADAITATTGWTDVSDVNHGLININMGGDTNRGVPIGTKNIAPVFAGPGNGTMNIQIVRNSDATDASDGAVFFAGVYGSASRRFAFVLQPDKDALTSGNTITPAASEGNPQITGSAVITSWQPFGAGGFEQAICIIGCEVDSDYTEHH